MLDFKRMSHRKFMSCSRHCRILVDGRNPRAMKYGVSFSSTLMFRGLRDRCLAVNVVIYYMMAFVGEL